MTILKNVLIKLARGGFTDRVLFIDNVPDEFFYEMRHPRKCVGEGQAQHYVEDTDKPKIPTLHPELELSQTGDGGIVFNMENEHSKSRFLALDRYIKSVFPNNRLPADPVVNSVDPMDSRAAALELSKIPRVVLPALSPSETPSVAGGTASSLDVEEIKRKAIEEYEANKKAEASERMAKARASRTATNK